MDAQLLHDIVGSQLRLLTSQAGDWVQLALKRGVQIYTCRAGGGQADEVAECLQDTELFEAVSLKSDCRRIQRFVTAQRAAGSMRLSHKAFLAAAHKWLCYACECNIRLLSAML